MIPPLNKFLNWNGLILIIFIVLIGIFLIGMPKYADDYWHAVPLVEWFYKQNIADINNGGDIIKYGFPSEEITQAIIERWNSDNVRLGNTLAIVFMIFPKWLGSGLALLVWIYIMFQSFILADIKFNKSALVGLGILLWGWFMPWQNSMGAIMFQFNYILATGISLWFIYLIFRKKNALLLFLVGIIVGWWHEGFSIPIAIGLLGLILLYKNNRNSTYYWGFIGVIVGILIIALMPSTTTRVDNFFNLSYYGLISKAGYAFANNILYYFLILIFIYLQFTKHKSLINSDRLVAFCIISGFIPILISLVTYTEARVTWWTQIVSIIAVLKVFKQILPNYWNKYKFSNLWWIFPCLILLFIHLSLADAAVIRMKNAQAQSIQDYIMNPDKTVFTDMVLSIDQPALALRMPDVMFYTERHLLVGKYLERWSGKDNFAMIPKELEFVDGNKGRILDGNIKAREFAGRIFVQADKVDKELYPLLTKHFINTTNFEIDYGNGYEPVGSWQYHFKSEKDGNDYIYFCVFNSWYKQHFKTVKGFRYNPH